MSVVCECVRSAFRTHHQPKQHGALILGFASCVGVVGIGIINRTRLGHAAPAWTENVAFIVRPKTRSLVGPNPAATPAPDSASAARTIRRGSVHRGKRVAELRQLRQFDIRQCHHAGRLGQLWIKVYRHGLRRRELILQS